jgi:hypothetical protein
VKKIQFAFALFAAHSFDVMSDRQLVLEAVQEMPETASCHEIVEELVLLAEVKRRLGKNPQGKGVPAEELLAQVSTWVSR